MVKGDKIGCTALHCDQVGVYSYIVFASLCVKLINIQSYKHHIELLTDLKLLNWLRQPSVLINVYLSLTLNKRLLFCVISTLVQ